MSDPTPTRPRQVTMAGWLIMVGSVFALGLVIDRLSGLHTLETQQKINAFLATSPGSELGIGSDTVVSGIRTLAMVTAGCATAAGILGYQVLRRSRSARAAVTVLAVPLFLAGTVTGGFITSVVAASAAILWLQPARAWFNGDPIPERRTALAPAAPATVAPSDAQRPPTVLWACVLTWVFSGLVVVGLLATAVVLAVSPDLMLDEAHRQNPDLADQGVSDTVLIGFTFLVLAGLVLWALSAAVLAVLVFRRIDWARIVLIVSAATCAVFCLVGVAVGAFLLVLPLLASVACIGMLLRADTRPWFARATPPGPPPPGVGGPLR
ncbi:hypothetical protein [Nocardioides conyzicola]|uniref:hypothetical protein n=1 Tax=Nocardioides conyzicola TaxID=1651781 RepID=UPI0031E8F176